MTIPQSPIPTGVRNALGEIYRMVEPVDPVSPVDLRVWLDPETMPIANLRLMLREQGFPAGDYIGEVFERRVASRPLLYYRRRNTASLLMELADDGEFSARIRWTPATGGPRTAATILVTPTALLGEATDWARASAALD